MREWRAQQGGWRMQQGDGGSGEMNGGEKGNNRETNKTNVFITGATPKSSWRIELPMNIGP
jgi:hypothetical protein